MCTPYVSYTKQPNTSPPARLPRRRLPAQHPLHPLPLPKDSLVLLVAPTTPIIASVVSPTLVIAPAVSLAFTKHPAHQSTALTPQNGRSCYTNECADPSRNQGIS